MSHHTERILHSVKLPELTPRALEHMRHVNGGHTIAGLDMHRLLQPAPRTAAAEPPPIDRASLVLWVLSMLIGALWVVIICGLAGAAWLSWGHGLVSAANDLQAHAARALSAIKSVAP